MQPAFEELHRAVETFLAHLAFLDFMNLLLTNGQPLAQLIPGDDVVVQAEGEASVEIDVLPVGTALLTSDSGDARHETIIAAGRENRPVDIAGVCVQN